MKDEYILGIESSCDETSMSILKNNNELLSNVISTQIKNHQSFGGVMPELAARLHLESVGYVLEECIRTSNIDLKDLSAVAVTGGPGLIGGLQVGMIAAKTIAMYYNIPLLYVHHLAGHIYANEFVKPLQFPCLAVVVSGGNSQLVYMKDHLSFEIIGETLDDALGESLDKVARVLGLPYPGGLAIDKLVKNHDIETIPLPKPHIDGYNLSYSGLKSHIIREIDELKRKGLFNNEFVLKYATSVEHAFMEQLINKVKKAAKDYNVKQIIIGGGVSANSYLRMRMKETFEKKYDLVLPPLWCTTDNAAMIAKVGHYLLERNIVSSLDAESRASYQLDEFMKKSA